MRMYKQLNPHVIVDWTCDQRKSHADKGYVII